MKKTDYDGIIAMLGNPDTVGEGLINLSNQLEKDESDFNRLNDSVNTLRDTNSKLALKITNIVDDKPSEEDLKAQRDKALEDEFLNMFKKEV